MDGYEYNKYVTDKDNLKDSLDKYGVAIIPYVLDELECTNMLNEMWKYFEHITQKWDIPISKDNEESWKQIYKLYPLHSMLIQHWNVGHMQCAWDIRQNEKVVDIFSQLWNCKNEELLVSFDGVSFNLPPEIIKRGWNRNNTWYHSDQSFCRNEFECIQSWITANDVNIGDATLSFMEGSHKFHKDCKEHFNVNDKKDWTKLTKEQEEFYLNKGCQYKKIYCPKGSLVLWDSRTIHCGTEAFKERKIPNIRAIIYLCYMPRSLCNQKDLIKKQKAFNELRLTTHWPSKVRLFSKNPRTYGNELPDITSISQPNLNPLGKKLAGF
jgi:ectoine hydroxylase-related dioxygenase (phytanoyl-CoA dioxygenase family)